MNSEVVLELFSLNYEIQIIVCHVNVVPPSARSVAVGLSLHWRPQLKKSCVKMALPGVSSMPLRVLCNIAKCFYSEGIPASNWSRGLRWYRTKARSIRDLNPSHVQAKQGNETLSLATLAN